jgi:integrase
VSKKPESHGLFLPSRLAVETAMRQGELLGLTWKSVDMKRKLIYLTKKSEIKNEKPRAVPLVSGSSAGFLRGCQSLSMEKLYRAQG